MELLTGAIRPGRKTSGNFEGNLRQKFPFPISGTFSWKTLMQQSQDSENTPKPCAISRQPNSLNMKPNQWNLPLIRNLSAAWQAGYPFWVMQWISWEP